MWLVTERFALFLSLCLFIGAGQWHPQDRFPGTVARIVDGDTFEATIAGNREKVRLIGIDTPESRNNKKARRDAASTGTSLEEIIALGEGATAFVESLLSPGDTVWLELDVQERDRYGSRPPPRS